MPFIPCRHRYIRLTGDAIYALYQRIKRMESEFQFEFAALVFQSHSEIMLKMIQLRFSNGIKGGVVTKTENLPINIF